MASGTPKIEMRKSVDKSSVQAGDILTYTITVKNKGVGDATGVTVKDFVPDCTAYVSCGGDGSGRYGSTTEGREFATWFIETLPAGGTANLTMTVKVNECNDAHEIRNRALLGVVGKPDRPSDGDTPNSPSNEVSTKVVSSGSRSAVPAKSTRSGMPQTGDTTVGTSVISLLVAGVTLAVAGGRRRRGSR